MRSDPGLRLHEGEPARRGLARLTERVALRADRIPIGRRLLLVMLVVMLMLAGALVDSLYSARRIETEYRNHISANIGRQVTFDKLYAQGLQMGQALRNVMLDPDNPKAYENYAKAAESFEKLLASARDADTQHFRSGLPDKIGALRASSGRSTTSSSPSSNPASSMPPEAPSTRTRRPNGARSAICSRPKSGASTSSRRSCWRGSSNSPISQSSAASRWPSRR
jgi:hypothetical protein